MALGAFAQTPGAPAAGPAQALPGAEAFFGRAAVESASLSPSGRWLAVRTAPEKSRVGLFVFDLSTMKPHAQAASFADADIGNAYWVNDETLVFDLRDDQRGGADQTFLPGLYSVNKDGKGQRLLIDIGYGFLREARAAGREPLSARHELLHIPKGGGNEVIVGDYPEPARDGQRGYVNAKRLDVTTGISTNLARGAPDNVRWWMFDSSGKPRLVYTSQGERGAYHWRERDDGPWRVLVEFERLSEPWSPRYVDTTGALFVTVSGGTDGTSELRKFDFATGKPEAQPLVRTPGFDFSGSIVSETQGDLALGVRVTTDAETTVWFQPQLQALQKAADERLPGHINRITCRRCLQDDIVAVVYSWNDRDPGQYWIYRGADKSWRKLADVRPAIDPRRMATTDMARVRTRDGLEIPVWVTRPPGPASPARAGVILVHGGPWVRGRSWQWKSDAQFLASRGYVVIEPEFRGSKGYGQRLFRAGWRQWGQAMQDDLVDALGWAVGKGWVDKDRVCIAGASYGGYATLMGLVRHPDSFRCGVAWAAVTDPRLMFKWSYNYNLLDDARAFDLPKLLGDPDTDVAMLEANAPVLQASRIRAPVMLAVGRLDRRVPLEHGERMRAALTAAGRPPEWVAYDDEGHGFFKVENRIDFMRRVDTFLAKNLGPR